MKFSKMNKKRKMTKEVYRRSGGKNLRDRVMDCRGDDGDFFCGNREGRSEKQVISKHAIDTALRGVSKDAASETCLANFLSDAFISRKRLTRSFIFYEFDSEEQTESTYFTNVGMQRQRSKAGAKLIGNQWNAAKELMFLEVVQNGVAGGSGNGMSLICKTVLK